MSASRRNRRGAARGPLPVSFFKGHFCDARGFAAHVEEQRKPFFRRPMNWAMEKSDPRGRTLPPLRISHGQPCGLPDTFQVGLPGLIRVQRVSVAAAGRSPESGRSFTLPLPPSCEIQAACGLPDTFSGRAYPVVVGAVFKCGHHPSAIWGRASTLPLAPYPRGNPSVRCGGAAPLKGEPKAALQSGSAPDSSPLEGSLWRG